MWLSHDHMFCTSGSGVPSLMWSTQTMIPSWTMTSTWRTLWSQTCRLVIQRKIRSLLLIFHSMWVSCNLKLYIYILFNNIVLCTGKSKAPPVLYPSYSTVYVWRCTQYSTACDNGDSFSLSNKAGKMQSTINQLKHGKGRAVWAITVLVVWSR